MKASETARKVIEWSLTGNGFPPRGGLGHTEALAHPDEPLAEAMRTLTGVTAAKFHWGSPPLGDKSPMGPGGAILAASLGALHIPNVAAALLNAAPGADGPGDWLLRHALVSRALPHLEETPPGSGTEDPLATLKRDLLRLSPLTALLTTPAPENQNTVIALVYRLIQQPGSRRWLQLNLARPVDDPGVRDWRRELLGRLQKTEADLETAFVLDVYEAQMIHHAREALEQIREAYSIISDPIAASNEVFLRDALSIAGWWRPLWEMRRSRNDDLRERLHLGYEYLKGLELCSLARKMTGKV